MGSSVVLSTAIPLPPLSDQDRVVSRITAIAGESRRSEAVAGGGGRRSGSVVGARRGCSLRRRSRMPHCRLLADIVEVRGGGTPSKSNRFLDREGRIPWASPKDMKLREIHDSIDHISEAATRADSFRACRTGSRANVVRGMILVSMVPSAVLRIPAAITKT